MKLQSTFWLFCNCLFPVTMHGHDPISLSHVDENDSYPLTVPVGPIDVENMRLNCIGSERSFPVMGDFILYFVIKAPISAALILSTYNVE